MSQKVSMVPLDRVKNSGIALRDLDEAAIKELAESIRANGLLQPIMVKPKGYRIRPAVRHSRDPNRAHRIPPVRGIHAQSQ